ncbi:MAG: MFS transporter [Muribaculaceae bacterium]|nr:MFS transporter [Muribaculaceae bacterium]MDY3933180.1 MFS transporter [Muribaculaceae bacterium]
MDNKQITGRVPMVARQYFVPFILITSLFFLWGGARAILDVLNKHVQMHFEAGYGESALIQCSVYMAYFLGAIPAGMLIRRYGTRRGVITGLLAFAVGAFLFIPASAFTRLSALLLPLFVLGLGLCLLETAANPYVTLLGDSRTSSSRINMSQTFNGLGCMMGALLGGLYFFSDGSTRSGEDINIAVPYCAIALVVLLVAAVFSRVKLPEVIMEQHDGNNDAPKPLGKTFVFGFIALLSYEISEISINTFFINFMTDDGFLTPSEATWALSFGGLMLFMVGRLMCSFIMTRVATERVFMVCATGAIVMMVAVISPLGVVSKAALVLTYLFESLMFPTIFALSIRGLGANTERASSILMMSVVGGAIGPLALGYVADMLSISQAFVVPLATFIVVWAFAMYMMREARRR